MYRVCVATGLVAEKVNLELLFDTPPSIARVMNHSAAAFNRLAVLRGYSGTEFAVSFAMIFDDYENIWVPLERSTQLTHNAQLYVFQPDVVDIPGPIPEPINASYLLENYASPPRSSSYYDSPRGAAPDVYGPRSGIDYPLVVEPRWRKTLDDVAMGDIPGESILREEQDRESRKISLPLDLHRETVRRETQEFLDGRWSPSRAANGYTV